MVERPRPGAVARDVLDLRSIRWMEDLSTQSLQSLAEQMDVVDLSGETLLKDAEQPLDRVFLVQSGSVSVQYGGRRRVATPEQPVVLLHALAGMDDELTIRCEESARVFVLRTDALWEALEEDFGLLVHSVKQLATTIGTSGRATGGAAKTLEFDQSSDLVPQIIWLQRTDTLSHAPVRAVGALARRSRLDSVRAGATLWPAGAPATSMCFVLSGTLIEGRQICGSGALVGETEALAEMPRTFPCLVSEPSRLMWLDVDTVWDVLEDHFALARHLLARLSRTVLDQVVPSEPSGEDSSSRFSAG